MLYNSEEVRDLIEKYGIIIKHVGPIEEYLDSLDKDKPSLLVEKDISLRAKESIDAIEEFELIASGSLCELLDTYHLMENSKLALEKIAEQTPESNSKQ